MKGYFITSLLLFTVWNSYSQEYAKILNHETNYFIEDKDNVEIEETYSIQINSDKGKRYAMYYDYTDQFRTIKNVKLEVKDLNGKRIKKLSKSDAIEYGGSASYEINDSKIFYIDPKYQNYPYIIEVTSTVKLKGFISLPVWVPRPYFNISIDKSTLTIKYPEALEVKFKEENIKVKEESKANGYLVKDYEVKSLPHVDNDIYYKEFYDLQPKVYISPLKFEIDNTVGGTASWEEFGDWFYQLNNADYQLTEKTKEYLDNLDKTDKRKFIRDVYQYMQDKTRYISIQLGIGGFKSIPTETVEATGYGDCKALSTYMKNMLDYAGIESNYILVKAGEDVPDVMADFPSNQFNHVFIGVPLEQDTVLLECTSQLMPYDYIGTFTDDRNVLWIAENNSKMIRSRSYDQEDNIQKNSAEVEIDENGNGIINLMIENTGIFFDDIMMYKSAPQDYIQRVNNNKFPYKDFTISDFNYNQPERDVSTYKSNFNIKVTGLGRIVNDKLLLPSNILLPISDYVDYNEFYKYAEVLRGLTVQDLVEIKLQDNYWAQKLPEEIELESNYGSYKWKVEADSEKIIISREIKFFKGIYSKEEFDSFLQFVKSIEKAERQNIILNSKT